LQSNLIAATAFTEPSKEWMYIDKDGTQVGPLEKLRWTLSVRVPVLTPTQVLNLHPVIRHMLAQTHRASTSPVFSCQLSASINFLLIN
jgi:DnaJ family protein C protein 13